MVKAQAGLQKNLMNKFLSISIVSDEDSWINDYISKFIERIEKNKHLISWEHNIKKVKNGDICFLLGCGQLMTKKVMTRNKINLVVHESAVPLGKGWSPLTWQILEGKNRIPITLLEVANKVDSGKIYLQDEIVFEGHELIDELRTVQASRTFMLCEKFIDNYPDLMNVEDNLPAPGIEWEINVDRKQASKFGVNINSIGNVIKLATNGLKLGEYRPDDSNDSIPMYLRYPNEGRTLDTINNLRISTQNGLVPISNFVDIKAANTKGNIVRVDSKNAINIQADVKPGVFADFKVRELEYVLGITDEPPFIRGKLMTDLPRYSLDRNIRAELIGENQDQQEAQSFLTKAFSVALFMMLMILLLQFNSFYSGFLILFAVVMSTAGVLIGLMITGQAFGIVMTGVGVIALAGIVVNNNIILIDTFDFLKNKTSNVKEAIIKTGAQRLRPVLLTTTTTVLGLLPMVTMTNIDFVTREVTRGSPDTQWWVQLSTAIVFGLIFATILTLIVTPSALMLKENVVNWYRKRVNS